jgi:hypothetical protein
MFDAKHEEQGKSMIARLTVIGDQKIFFLTDQRVEKQETTRRRQNPFGKKGFVQTHKISKQRNNVATANSFGKKVAYIHTR